MFKISHCVVGQARMLADDAGFDLAADQEHRGGGTVVCSLAAVLIRPAAKFRESHHQNPILVTTRGHVLVEGRHSARYLLEQVRMGGQLVGMGIEAVDRNVENAGAQFSVDELSG